MGTKTINALVCVLIAPWAFAQTSTTTEQKTNTQPTRTTETTVTTTYNPGKIIIIGSESTPDTFSYVLDKTVRYLNKDGGEMNAQSIKPGTRIHVYFDGAGQTRVINRVVVEED